MKFDCIQSTDDYVKMASENSDGKGMTETTFEVYRRIDFNSDRKRMSLLFRDPNDGKCKLMIKGADSVIKDRLDPNQFPQDQQEEIEWFLNTASKQGLRTLLMGMKIVSDEEKDDFLAKCKKAESDLKNRETLLD